MGGEMVGKQKERVDPMELPCARSCYLWGYPPTSLLGFVPANCWCRSKENHGGADCLRKYKRFLISLIPRLETETPVLEAAVPVGRRGK